MSKETFWTDELVKKILREVTSFEAPEHWDKIVSEFKQSKMPKKEWEIVEFISPKDGRIRKERDDLTWEEWGIHLFGSLTINAVKRLSDGEVFEVGETIRHTKANEPVKIISFYINDKSEMACLCESPNIHSNYYIENWVKLPPQKEQSKPEQPKKERIEITQYSNINIPEEKFPAIKAALERVLNDEWEDETKIYSKEDHYILIEAAQSAAFNAGKEVYCATAMGQRPKYWTFEEYIKSKQ